MAGTLRPFATLFGRAFCSALLLTSIHSQPTSAPLRGRVLDATGAPIRAARITIVPSGPSTASNANGEFEIALAPGAYTLRIQADGFAELLRTVSHPLADAGVLDFVLTVDDLRQTITVTEAPDYRVATVNSGTRTPTPLRDVPQSITVVTRELIRDQSMMSIGDVVRYVPGITAIQGENNRDQVVIRGNSTSADFFLDGVRDDVQYYRDLYNIDRVEALKGPNAMIFGRGDGGGAINRVTKTPDFMTGLELGVQTGSYGDRRFTADWDHPLTRWAAFRFNGVYESTGSSRDFVNLERHGLNPVLTLTAGPLTRLAIGFENLRDDRVADRGVPSYQGRPAATPLSLYFGDPRNSHVGARVNLGFVAVEHQAGQINVRSRLTIANYDRGYQNFVPGAVTTDGTEDSLSAYNNATRRRNFFDQTDITYAISTGPLRHTVLFGAEGGVQLTNNFRNTGYFNGATSILVPLAEPAGPLPVAFGQSATDANNHLQTNLGAGYFQDQIRLTARLRAIAGVRFDYFDLQYHDNRTGIFLRRIDHLTSPRAGLVFDLAARVSLYGSYSVSYLPSSGDQFASLTVVTQQVKPEQFSNYEMGIKWDLGRGLSITTAVYRLDRTNTRSTDPRSLYQRAP